MAKEGVGTNGREGASAREAGRASRVRLEPSWLEALGPEFDKPYLRELSAFLRAQKAAGKRIYPRGDDLFRAFECTPLPRVRVVLLGQDPYHGPGQAQGLCFSVRPPVPPPPSLQNIFRELAADLGVPAPSQGNLEPWARQGVLLLNTVLSVEHGKAGSHRGRGWETFTDCVLETVLARHEKLVFLLWGSQAQRKADMIDRSRHCVLEAPHPSPLSAHRGFIGCGHFSRANAWLESRGQAPIDWRLPARVDLTGAAAGAP